MRTFETEDLNKIRSQTKHRVDDDGYRVIYAPNHPLAWRNGWLSEHRFVAYYGAYMPDEIDPQNVRCDYCGYGVPWRSPMGMKYCVNVDHLNCDRLDNRSSNLAVSCYSCNTNRKYQAENPDVFQEFCRAFSHLHPADRPDAYEFFEDRLRRLRNGEHAQPTIQVDLPINLLKALCFYSTLDWWEEYPGPNPVSRLLELLWPVTSEARWGPHMSVYRPKWIGDDIPNSAGIREYYPGLLTIDCSITRSLFPDLAYDGEIAPLSLAAMMQGCHWRDLDEAIGYDRLWCNDEDARSQNRLCWNFAVADEINELIGAHQ